MILGCRFFQNEWFDGHEVRQIGKTVTFLTGITYYLANVRCELLTFVTGCTHE